jgi:hypothetical protein
VLSNEIVTHWNAGATVTPSAPAPLGGSATTRTLKFGASAVWLFRPSVNFLLETVVDDSKVMLADGRLAGETGWVLNPGIRGALDLGNLQIVPGVAYTIGLGAGRDQNALFLYLSLEHPFRRQ